MVAEGIFLWPFSSKRGESGILAKSKSVLPLLLRHAEHALQAALSLSVCLAPNNMVTPNMFNPNVPRYANSYAISLPFPTAFTPALIAYGLEALNVMYRTGYRYKKVGVQIGKIMPNVAQPDLFGDNALEDRTRQDRLMFIIDALNRIYGRDTLFFAVQGVNRTWGMRRLRLSQRFTTSWDELLTI